MAGRPAIALMCLVSPERVAHCEAIIKRQAAREVKAQPDPDGMRELRALAARYGTDIFDIVDRFLKGLLSAEAAQELFRALAAATHTDAHILGQEVAGVQGVVRGLAVDRGTMMGQVEMSYFRGFLGALNRSDMRYWDPEADEWRMDQIARRAGMYTPKAESSAGFGWVDNHEARQQFNWILGAADHCFPAGAMVDTPGGRVAIEKLAVGDLVWTRLGAKRIKRVMASTAPAKMVRIKTSRGVIQCTANHPLLTARGWVAAGRVKQDDVLVHCHEFSDAINGEFAFPDANDGETLRFKDGVRLPVPAPLQLLPVSQWLEAGVAMPVFPVALNHQSANSRVGKAIAGKRVRGLKRHPKLHQVPLKPALGGRDLALLLAMLAFMQSPQNSVANIGVGLNPGGNLGASLGAEHRVVVSHVVPGPGNREFSGLRGVQFEPHVASNPGDVFGVNAKLGGDSLGPFALVAGADGVFDRLGVPLGQMLGAEVGLSVVTNMPTNGASLAFDPLDVLGVGGVAAGYGAVSSGVVLGVGDRPAADRASTLRLCSVHAIELYHQEPSKVYNLEVEDAHEYFVDGHLVHNCTDCPILADMSPYYRETLYTMPRECMTPCMGNCKCRVETVEGVASFDPVEFDLVASLGLAA